MKRNIPEETVLVGVLKDRRDRALLFHERWYRIPVAFAPTRAFRYLAFYQPATFGREGKRIQYYARVLRSRVCPRRELLPRELQHPRVGALYRQLWVGKVRCLPRLIRNVVPRRVSFGFTTLRRLRGATNMLQLYGVVPTEEIVRGSLARLGIPATPQHSVFCAGKRYRLDFAIVCRRGSIAVECDNTKAHAGRRQRAKDRAKDADVRRCGFVVLRITEHDIVSDLRRSMERVRRMVNHLGGVT